MRAKIEKYHLHAISANGLNKMWLAYDGVLKRYFSQPQIIIKTKKHMESQLYEHSPSLVYSASLYHGEQRAWLWYTCRVS